MVAGSGPCGVWRGGSSASCCCAGWPTSGPTWSPRRCRGWAPPAREAHAAHTRWQALQHSPRAPRGLALRTAVLGPPEELEDRRFGDLDVQVRRWPLPLWPHLYWEVLSGPGGAVLQRAPGAGARARRCRRPRRVGCWSGSTCSTTSSACPARESVDPGW